MSDTTGPADLTLPGLVHDLNNVFETISEAADLVSSDPQWANLAAAIHRSVDRGRRIVGCYAGQSRSGTDLDVAIDRAATFLHDFLPLLPGTKVKLHKKTQAGQRVQGDSGDWERVFMNLFLNAAQAMKEGGGGEIEVVSQARDSMVEMSVADSGPGIPESILGKIFSARFSTKTKQAGLGLHIVHSIVQKNGGAVKAGNRDGGRGAVFTILAPAAEPD
ncbi:MAG: HAMP domain-containing histidine kinase [Acidobacteria bacterium]|nr:HAMP domain-containing histidine kinase [Acidobacteriota bacterium]